MTERVDEFTDKLRDRLNGAEARLEQVKTSIAAAKTETRASIEGKIAEAKASAEAQKSALEDAQARMKSDLEEKKAATQEHVATWKQERQVKKLERRAQFAEDDAMWAMLVAADAIDNANLRALDAIVTRMDADEAAGAGDQAAAAAQ